MGAEFYGAISGAFVAISAIPYSIRVFQKKITINVVTWILWTFIGFTLLLTFHGAGAKDNIWPAVFGFTNPLLVVLIATVKKQHIESATAERNIFLRVRSELTGTDQICLFFGVVAIGIWIVSGYTAWLKQASVIAAVVADLCAAIPTILFVWKNPQKDRPTAWVLFSVGYALSFAAVPVWTMSNILIPSYMTTFSLAIALPLILYRVREGIPVKEWI